MGRDIPCCEFSEDDFKEFKRRLREENVLLADWFKNGLFDTGEEMCGFELEMWLVDKNYHPSPINEEFLNSLSNHLVVPELSKFNFEINSTPHRLEGSLLSNMERELGQVWKKCAAHAEKFQSNILAIGILPTVRDEMLTIEQMSSLKRYAALNRQILRLRGEKPLEIHIEGNDSLYVQHRDVMVEAVATSLQIHIQVNPSDAVRYYNLSQTLSAPLVAVAANSPYLFEKDLWDETRIPTFEQSVSVASFRDSQGEVVGRVTFGTGYARQSMIEPFLENLDGYPILLPLVFEEESTLLSHLRLHNGTIWRWNRPLIGFGKNLRPHIRIEHRVAAAGPSIPDTIANIGFYLGLVHYFAAQKVSLDKRIPFRDAKANFYRAAKHGLNATVKWVDGKETPLQALIENSLLPAAKEGLRMAGCREEDVSFYIGDIIEQRVRTGKNGAAWQRSYIRKHGPDFKAMTHHYFENQNKNLPVHEWTV